MIFDINMELDAKIVPILGKPIIEIENFYRNPDSVRQFALESKKYTKDDNDDLIAGAVGRRVCQDSLELTKLSSVFEQLCNHSSWHIDFDKDHHEYYWSGMRFLVNVTNNLDILDDGRDMIMHVDGPDKKWACVIYLNTNEECEGGTGFYSLNMEKDEVNLEYLSQMMYNKAVLYDANMIHGAIMEKHMFKTCDRLVQVMFM
jgi:hypothetical protein